MALEMQKIGFPLHSDGEWPPFDVEYLWVKRLDTGYKIKNSPFFVKNLAFDDIISAEIDPNGNVLNWNIVTLSGNSTIWVFVRRKRSDVIDKLISCGCQIEGEPIKNLYSVIVPKEVKIEEIDAILDSYKKKRAVSAAFPAFRHVE